jgi:hypothetical protein
MEDAEVVNTVTTWLQSAASFNYDDWLQIAASCNHDDCLAADGSKL